MYFAKILAKLVFQFGHLYPNRLLKFYVAPSWELRCRNKIYHGSHFFVIVRYENGFRHFLIESPPVSIKVIIPESILRHYHHHYHRIPSYTNIKSYKHKYGSFPMLGQLVCLTFLLYRFTRGTWQTVLCTEKDIMIDILRYCIHGRSWKSLLNINTSHGLPTMYFLSATSTIPLKVRHILFCKKWLFKCDNVQIR